MNDLKTIVELSREFGTIDYVKGGVGRLNLPCLSWISSCIRQVLQKGFLKNLTHIT